MDARTTRNRVPHPRRALLRGRVGYRLLQQTTIRLQFPLSTRLPIPRLVPRSPPRSASRRPRSTPLFPHARKSLYKTRPYDSPRSTRFWTIPTHSRPVSLSAYPQPLCVVWKTPSPIHSLCPLFLVTVCARVRFWKPCTNSPPSIYADLPPLSTLPPTTTTTTRNIYPFTLFLRSILPAGIFSSLTPALAPTSAASAATQSPSPSAQDPHKMPPEIHRVYASHEPPRTT